MLVEPESLCWVLAQRVERLDGAGWAEELGRLPPVEQVVRDAGSCLSKGVDPLNAVRTHWESRVRSDLIVCLFANTSL